MPNDKHSSDEQKVRFPPMTRNSDTLEGTFELHPVSKPDSLIRGRFKGTRTR